MGSWRSRHDPLPAWAATLLVVSLGAPLRAQSEGDLDASYGDPAAPGRQVRYFDLGPTGYDLVTGAATDGAGRALAVGLVETVDVTFPYALGLARFDRKGQVDEAFGNEPARPGTVTLDLPSSQEIPGRSIEVLSDGRIVVAGSRLLASVLSSVGFFSRIAADGSAVETTVSFNLPATPTALPPRVRGFARDGDGRYLAFGDVLAFGQPMVARLTSAFAIDAAYGSGGWIGIDPFEPGESGSASVRQLRLDAQGRAIGVLSGTISGGDDFSALFRLLPSARSIPISGRAGSRGSCPTSSPAAAARYPVTRPCSTSRSPPTELSMPPAAWTMPRRFRPSGTAGWSRSRPMATPCSRPRCCRAPRALRSS